MNEAFDFIAQQHFKQRQTPTTTTTTTTTIMQRGLDASGGLGPQLVGEKINVNRRVVSVVRQLGEGARD